MTFVCLPIDQNSSTTRGAPFWWERTRHLNFRKCSADFAKTLATGESKVSEHWMMRWTGWRARRNSSCASWESREPRVRWCGRLGGEEHRAPGRFNYFAAWVSSNDRRNLLARWMLKVAVVSLTAS